MFPDPCFLALGQLHCIGFAVTRYKKKYPPRLVLILLLKEVIANDYKVHLKKIGYVQFTDFKEHLYPRACAVYTIQLGFISKSIQLDIVALGFDP